jgi:hypothetical protein
MTDDQQTTSGQDTVNSEQQKNTVHSPLPTNHPEPLYQDELDVYEAVAKLEKKYGKKLLTDEQKEKLVVAGRMGNQKVNIKDIKTLSNLIAEGLWLDAEKEGAQIYPTDAWDKLDKSDKRRVGFSQFIANYGISPETFRNELEKRMMGRDDGK